MEDEFHLLYRCLSLQTVRSNFYNECIPDLQAFFQLDDVGKTKYLLSAELINLFGHDVNALLIRRREILYKPS